MCLSVWLVRFCFGSTARLHGCSGVAFRRVVCFNSTTRFRACSGIAFRCAVFVSIPRRGFIVVRALRFVVRFCCFDSTTRLHGCSDGALRRVLFRFHDASSWLRGRCVSVVFFFASIPRRGFMVVRVLRFAVLFVSIPRRGSMVVRALRFVALFLFRFHDAAS